MNRKEAEDFVYKSYLKAEKHQDYNAKDADKRRPDLTKDVIRSKAGTPCVLVTGSKGKGSVANMISQIMQTKYNVGLMTSPHILDFCERFRINGRSISDDDLAKYMTFIQPEIDSIDESIPENVCVSPMGIQAILGLEYFNAKNTDFNVFECGKGAQYDDVNNVLHQYAVINSIFLEHTRELGDTLEAIAEDKAHVINGEQNVVYVAEQGKAVLEVIQSRASEYGVTLKVYGRDFWAENIRFEKSGMHFDVNVEGEIFPNIIVPLMGKHQAMNCAIAIALCKDVMKDMDIDKVRKNLLEIDWPGRMEIVSDNPFIMLDACINAASCKNVKDVLKHLSINEATVIIGIPDDKDYSGVIKEMSGVSNNILITKSRNPHYTFTKNQCEEMKKMGITTEWTESVGEALEKAKGSSLPIVILGTTSVVSEVKLNALASCRNGRV